MGIHIGHAALRVVDLDAAAEHARLALGLRETYRTDSEVRLSASEKDHELQLLKGDEPGLDHVGLEVDDPGELSAIEERVVAAGVEVAAAPAETTLGRALRFVGPGGIGYEVYDGMKRDPLTPRRFLRPGIRRLGHLTFFCADHVAIVRFWVDTLGLRVSDEAEGMTWTRCDADHHGLAIGPRGEGPAANVLHHHAWEVRDFAALGQYCDSLAADGLTLYWGPVRHGPGSNLAVYLPGSEGVVIEVYTDLLQIPDDRAYEPIDWSETPNAMNLWGPAPGADLLSAGTPVLAPNWGATAPTV